MVFEYSQGKYLVYLELLKDNKLVGEIIEECTGRDLKIVRTEVKVKGNFRRVYETNAYSKDLLVGKAKVTFNCSQEVWDNYKGLRMKYLLKRCGYIVRNAKMGSHYWERRLISKLPNNVGKITIDESLDLKNLDCVLRDKNNDNDNGNNQLY